MGLVNVKMGEIVITEKNEETLFTVLGSCVGVGLFDLKNRIAGVAHVMLPSRDDSQTIEKPGKYAETAVLAAARLLVSNGAERKYIRSKIAGGATMFETGLMGNIGERNIVAVKSELKRLKIPLIAEDTGGGRGRSMFVRPGDDAFVIQIAGGERRTI